MKKAIVFVSLFLISVIVSGQHKNFRFAFISDTHIGSPNGSSEEDLRRTVRDINEMNDIKFVVITGDITELGTNQELAKAKQILDSLDISYYIIPGNHDTGWSESGGEMFAKTFGYDKFSFEFEGIRFIGSASGPYVRMSDGHVPRNQVNWLDAELKKLKPGQPLIFLNHYPINAELDNWYEITDRLHSYNTWAILCGHGHANRSIDFEDIPGVMGRSNLRAKATVGGYNLVDVRTDSMLFTERRPGQGNIKTWTGVKIERRNYSKEKEYPRPDYRINTNYPQARETWRYTSGANIISTPATDGTIVIAGDQAGKVFCLSLIDGKEIWKYNTGGSIYSSPAIAGNLVVLGSTDGMVYCFDKAGKLKWKIKTGAPVLGSPLIDNDKIYIGGSGNSFRELELTTGKTIWEFTGLDGPVVSKPLLHDGMIIFGAWDRHLYALNKNDGSLVWKWNNGSSVRNFSPASCIPVAYDGVIYIVAPDRYITALEAGTGKMLWRNNDATVRESIGISENNKWVYGKTMQDTVVAYATSKLKQSAAWKMHVGFGYEHVPSMLIEKEGTVFFGTKNGVVYAIDPSQQTIRWAHKIDNSMVNTVNVINGHRLLAATMDGQLVLIENEN